jgi:hypothetical protein
MIKHEVSNLKCQSHTQSDSKIKDVVKIVQGKKKTLQLHDNDDVLVQS